MNKLQLGRGPSTADTGAAGERGSVLLLCFNWAAVLQPRILPAVFHALTRVAGFNWAAVLQPRIPS